MPLPRYARLNLLLEQKAQAYGHPLIEKSRYPLVRERRRSGAGSSFRESREEEFRIYVFSRSREATGRSFTSTRGGIGLTRIFPSEVLYPRPSAAEGFSPVRNSIRVISPSPAHT